MAARTILSLVAAATCVAANAPIINPLISSSQSTNNNNRLGITPRTTRQLQEADGSSYAYLDDLTGYSLQYATCVRAKIPQENDDDEAEEMESIETKLLIELGFSDPYLSEKE